MKSCALKESPNYGQDQLANLNIISQEVEWQNDLDILFRNSNRHFPTLNKYLIYDLWRTNNNSKTYKAVRSDGLFNRKVLIKIFNEPINHRVLQNEGSILSQIAHESIVSIYNAGITDNELPYLVLESVQGHSISSYCHINSVSLLGRLKLIRQQFCIVIAKGSHMEP